MKKQANESNEVYSGIRIMKIFKVYRNQDRTRYLGF